jgi:Macrocin-O-methyltransferase (TylF)
VRRRLHASHGSRDHVSTQLWTEWQIYTRPLLVFVPRRWSRDYLERIDSLVMQQEMTPNSSPLGGTTVKYPTRVITYAWGKKYVDTLLTLTLPALLAPGNLPHVASEVPCELIILTQRRFFSQLNQHPTITRARNICPVRFIRLDDLIVSKDKYGMTLTYALHRGFSDLGPAMTEHWQIFLNADFILADGSLRTVIGHLSRGEKIVAAPSYCTIAEEVIPELRKHLDDATSTLSISRRELARLILQHPHTVIRGKTVNQTSFHMRYADQFYWSVDDTTLIGYQMPVSIVGLRPERYLAEPNSYWDFGLIWEYCPNAEVCVIGDSDEFTMLELRDRSVAEDQIIPGPVDKKAIAERMVTWVTPYQHHFLKFPLTLHDRDLPPNIDDAHSQLRSFVDDVMSHAPALPSHIKHSQWEYHWAAFQDARRISSRIRALNSRTGAWIKLRFAHARSVVIDGMTSAVIDGMRSAVTQISAPLVDMELQVRRRAYEFARGTCLPLAIAAGKRLLSPVLHSFGLEILKSRNLFGILKQRDEYKQSMEHYRESMEHFKESTEYFKHHMEEYRASIGGYQDLIEQQRRSIEELQHLGAKDKAYISDLKAIITDYQLKLERNYDYQAAMVQDQIRLGLSNLEPEFRALYEQCREYTMTSWERLYALYRSVQYVVENRIPGDIVECGVWRGGSMKLSAHVLLALGVTDRTLFLYDTFEGMTEPDPEVDVDASGNKAANDWLEVQRRGVKWSYAPIEEVRDVIAGSGYPMDKVVFVKGPVEDTIPATVPDRISLLRLDTDWYSSTKHEMEHLYPKLSPQGILILDDYGHYQGARRGVDEYLSKLDKKPLLQRIDYSCRLAVKPTA